MSKQLAKILSICILVVLMPFIIVGSAITFTNAVEVVLTIAEAGDEGTLGATSSDIAIIVDGKEVEGNTIAVRKNTQVEVYYDGTGYNFEGWFKGSEKEIGAKQKPMYKKEGSFTYTISKSTTLTAVRNVQTYNITYLDEAGNEIETTPNVEYGAQLRDYTTSKVFSGWYVENDAEKTTSVVANYEVSAQAASIRLMPLVQQNAVYTVYYNVNNETTNIASLQYDMTNGFEQYTEVREGYTFAGITLGDSLYEYDATEKNYINDQGKALSDAIKEQPTAKLYATWESIYPAMSFSIMGAEEDGTSIDGKTIGGQWVEVFDETYVTAYIQDTQEAGVLAVDINNDFYETFMSKYTEFKTVGGVSVTFTGKVCFENTSNINQSYTVTFGSTTFKDVMEYLASEQTLVAGTAWDVTFYFA